MGFIYFDVNHAITTHDQILKISGGFEGVKNRGALESILYHITNDDYYPSYIDKLTHLVFAVNKGHCFEDGNKRTSIALGAFFLEVNGLDVLASRFMIEMENIAVSVADNLIDKNFLHEIIDSIINEDDYSEELKLKIIDALS
ncbi:death on curing protein [Chitinophaga costaii]|uniref:Death on curing protein n=1 Tax=Chitinophaga costaii TaxID=1335309 RepID=A0A1C4FX22_9BACT|nr:type II toxin-antitoxin system death-on-curing family toxin [Chitinophaga costaii]PUZ27276.1 type II toxin-antitoxin system death-on-curing family toxin [Chitinophaga costaii]SCC60213.1 death on curing protein [Chitinophaga costaii]